jgi:hypothetical protein
MGRAWPDGYSAHVEVYLVIADERIDIAQIGKSSFVLRDPRTIAPSTPATLVLKIDGKEEREEIILRDGATDALQRVVYSSC